MWTLTNPGGGSGAGVVSTRLARSGCEAILKYSPDADVALHLREDIPATHPPEQWGLCRFVQVSRNDFQRHVRQPWTNRTSPAQFTAPNPCSSRDRIMHAACLPCPRDAVADTITVPYYPTLKARQRDLWASGSCAVVETTPQNVGEKPCETLDLQARKTLWMSPRVTTMPPLLPPTIGYRHVDG